MGDHYGTYVMSCRKYALMYKQVFSIENFDVEATYTGHAT
jgi:hypothetical protein